MRKFTKNAHSNWILGLKETFMCASGLSVRYSNKCYQCYQVWRPLRFAYWESLNRCCICDKCHSNRIPLQTWLETNKTRSFSKVDPLTLIKFFRKIRISKRIDQKEGEGVSETSTFCIDKRRKIMYSTHYRVEESFRSLKLSIQWNTREHIQKTSNFSNAKQMWK